MMRSTLTPRFRKKRKALKRRAGKIDVFRPAGFRGRRDGNARRSPDAHVPSRPARIALACEVAGDTVAGSIEFAKLFDVDMDDLAGGGAFIAAAGSAGSSADRRLRPRRSRIPLTVAAETPTSAAICLPVWRCLRKPSTAAQTAGVAWLDDERAGGKHNSTKWVVVQNNRRGPTELSAFGIAFGGTAQSAGKPVIVFIVDDLGFADVDYRARWRRGQCRQARL
jgi:hypothetical protein